jgi:hypothetical protein
MPTDRKSDLVHSLILGHQRNIKPSLHPQKGASLEALSRLAQEIAKILQRLRTEGESRVDHVQRGD